MQLIKRLSRRFGLTVEQCEDLQAFESYINWKNSAGYFDIIGNTSEVDKPIVHDERKATDSPQWG